MAEAALRRFGGARFRAHSAGTHPKAAPHPLTLYVLWQRGHDTQALRPKSWEIFAGADAAPLEFVFTVCDDAQGEACPAWAGQPLTAHWGVHDPARALGQLADRLHCFQRAYDEIERRVRRFTNLAFDRLDRLSLASELAAIGKSTPAADLPVASLASR